MTKNGVRPRSAAIGFAALGLVTAVGFAQQSSTRSSALDVRALDLTNEPLTAIRSTAQSDARAQSILERVKAARADARQSVRQRMTEDQSAAFVQLEERTVGTVEMHLREGAGTPRMIKGRSLRAAPPTQAASKERDRETARSFLREQSDLLLLENPDDELQVVRESEDSTGRRQIRFAQRYKGIPVWPAEVIVQVNVDGDVELMTGGFYRTPTNAIVEPRLAANEAIELARSAVGQGELAGEPELVLYVAHGTTTPRLGWRMELHLSLDSHRSIVIDARSGRMLRNLEQICTVNTAGSGVDALGNTRPLNVWDFGGGFTTIDTSKQMYDPTSDPLDLNNLRGGIIVLDFQNGSDPNTDLNYVQSANANSWPVADSVGALWGLSETYDYYLERHQRNSLDGNGGTLFAAVRYQSGYNNAFFSDPWMVFGDAVPYAASLDVVSHELSHGVTNATANLEYSFQSGALNEAFSDIFGEMVEARTFGTNDWLLGSALTNPLRNMADPGSIDSGLGPYPSTMSEFYTLDANTDAGGVHINSSIPNRAYYLLAEGFTNSIGRADAERIFYRALTTKLVVNSQFIDARLACIASAEELFGAGSAQAERTADAFDAVEIGASAGSDGPVDTTPVSNDDALAFLFWGGANFQIGRRETAFGDPNAGAVLVTNPPAKEGRLRIDGSGELGIYVSDAEDAVLFATSDGSVAEVGLPADSIYVSAIAMAADANQFAFVLLDGPGGNPTNEITIIDIASDTGMTYTLASPSSEAGALNQVLFADQMEFSADNRLLIYDAFNQVDEAGGSTYDAWSIYALDLVTGSTFALIAPNAELDIVNPSIAKTNDGFLTFEAFDPMTGMSDIYAADWLTGELNVVATVSNLLAYPVYNGDDTSIVYSVEDGGTPTGASLFDAGVTNRIMPAGTPTQTVADAAYGTVYRRGAFTTPNTAPNAVISSPVSNVTINVGDSVMFTATGSDPNGHYPMAYNWDFGGAATSSSAEDPGMITFNSGGTFLVTMTGTDSQGLDDSTPDTRVVTVMGGGGGGGCAYNPGGGFDPMFLLAGVLLFLLSRRREADSRA